MFQAIAVFSRRCRDRAVGLILCGRKYAIMCRGVAFGEFAFYYIHTWFEQIPILYTLLQTSYISYTDWMHKRAVTHNVYEVAASNLMSS